MTTIGTERMRVNRGGQIGIQVERRVGDGCVGEVLPGRDC
jgi:hypothetical protein